MFIIDRIKALKLILLFALLNISMYLAFPTHGFSLLRIIMALMILSSATLLIIFFFRIERTDLTLNPYFKLLLLLLLLWSFFTIARSISSNQKDLMSLFGHHLMGWTWIAPLAVIFGLDIFNWINIFNYLGKILLFGVFLSLYLFFSPSITFAPGVAQWLVIFPILLLTSIYQEPFFKKIIFFAMISFVCVSIYDSQRINAVYFSLTIFYFIFQSLKNSNMSKIKKVFVLSFVSLVVLVAYVESANIYNDISKNKTLTTDTRTFLVEELYQDMSNSELIIGRGALGTYYSPYFAILKRSGISGGDSPVRSVNEIGYLEMVLKGGYIMVALYLLILIPAAYLGIFKSKNMIARMCGYFISIYLITWTVSFYPVYSIQFILLWMAAGTAISPTARNMTDSELLKFQKKYDIE